MADTIERLYKLTVDGTAAARQLGEIARATDSLDKKMAGAINGITKFAGVLAAAFSAQQVVGAIQRNIDAMDELSKAVQKVGIGAEDLQRLRYAADLSGLSAEQLDKAVASLAVGMSDLAKGTNETSKALRAIGAKTGEGPIETLKRIADQFAKMPDGIAKTALAIDLFGKKVGPNMIPLLNQGGAAMQKLADEADRFGGVLTGGTLAAAEAFNDNMSRLHRTVAGIGAQMTAGMLPALVAITQDLTNAATKGDGFVTTGEAIGKVLTELYGIGIKTTATLSAFARVLSALQEIKQSPGSTIAIVRSMMADIDLLGANANLRLAELRLNLLKAKDATAAGAAAGAGGKGTDPAEAARLAAERAAAALKAQKDATAALEEQERRRMSAAKVLIEIEEAQARVAADLAEQTARYKRETDEAAKATTDLIRSLDPAGAAAEDFASNLSKIDELFFSGKISGEQYDRMVAQLTGTFGKTAEATAKTKNELDVLNDGFDGFFNNLANGAADVEDVFRRMVQSIIAELLKLWARKYILDAIFGTTSGGAAPAAAAAAFATPSAFAFPSASSASAGPSAFATGTSTGATIAPLRLGGSGGAGMPQQQQPALQVTINNNAPGVQVDTRQTPSGLEVIISQVKAALTADVLRGGNDFANANERTWGLSRGTAAAF